MREGLVRTTLLVYIRPSYHFLVSSSSLIPPNTFQFFSMAMQLPPATIYTGRSSVVLPPMKSPNLHRSSFLPYYSMNKKLLSKSSSFAPKFSMRTSSKQAYICRDCGYIYNDRTPFEKLPDNYFCPVCAAPKRRFRPYMPDVSKNVNDKDVRKARKAELQRDEAIGKALPIAIAVGVLALAALYFYVNNTT